MAAILDASLNLTPFARDPDCPPKFFFTYLGVHYQDQESKWGDIWLHTGSLSAPGLSWLSVMMELAIIVSCEFAMIIYQSYVLTYIFLLLI